MTQTMRQKIESEFCNELIGLVKKNGWEMFTQWELIRWLERQKEIVSNN